MEQIMDELYYMVDDLASQQSEHDEEARGLKNEKAALQDKIAKRIGPDGWEVLEALASLNLQLEDIHDKALFQAAVRLGTELAQEGRGGRVGAKTSPA